ncbi:BRCA1-A complex subunit RAP80 isoform X2 [Scophthalmus maximus]|uniref:BRCA1-A complex subunit RAP80 isoform X2 n=1 Tax=Scophthalmus maximus TaxID=52904 RepID=UPI001FA88667|nr:BRCA1-A complex subunit RAP80 isoform X2 [Scophthalmus maximus]
MSLRKQAVQDASFVPSETESIDENTQELEVVVDDDDDDDGDAKDELSSALLSPSTATRHKRRRERENKPKSKEMTEEEMMDLALRMSEQEASDDAFRLQQEEAAVMKAIEESMVAQSQSLLADGDSEPQLRLCSRPKLSRGKRTSALERMSPDTDQTRETKGAGDENNNNNRNKKRKRKEAGSPEVSLCSSEPQDSPQSSDSTQIDDCPLRTSPVFPSSACRAAVHIPRLGRDLLDDCRTSGFVLCSQDTFTSTLPAQPESPTFPRSPGVLASCTKSPVFSETEQGDSGAMHLSPEYLKSPVFGRNTQREESQHDPLISVCTSNSEHSGIVFSSQDSSSSSVRTASCRPHSPVFPRSPGLPVKPRSPERSSICPVPDRGQKETSEAPSASEVKGPNGDVTLSIICGPSQRTRQARRFRVKSVDAPDDRSNAVAASPHSDDSLQLIESPEEPNAAATEPSVDMTLLWSDEDEDDVTPAGSPSPVFPEERPVGGAAEVPAGAAAMNHVTAASPGTDKSESSSACRQQRPTTELQPTSSSSQGASPTPTVHYYWGVPFCPRGLDPDSYTQVILAQMNVYDQSLKLAQRRLLRKAPWGDAILPRVEKSPSPDSPAESPHRPAPRRRGLRLRDRNQCETRPEEEEEQQDGEEEEGEKEKSEGVRGGGGGGEEPQTDTDECEVCPETQLSNHDDDDDSTQDLTTDADAGAVLRPESPDLPEVETIPPDVAQPPSQEDGDEMEVDVCGTSEGKPQEATEEERPDPVEEVKRGRMSTSPEAEKQTAAIVPPIPEAVVVDCPICQGSFPAARIEWHAAYCDGEVAVVGERHPAVSLKPCRKRPRQAQEMSDSSDRNPEKCYICQKNVPLRDYSRHTELCLRQRRPDTSDSRGNLLSALEQTENRSSEAGPSGSRLQPREVIDLRDDDDEDEEGAGGSTPAVRISNSPIRSFTPISEAAGCLIDFRRQPRVKKMSRRRR